MFKNVGKKIKLMSVLLLIAGILLSLYVGVLGHMISDGAFSANNDEVILGAVIVIVGIIASVILSLIVNGFGVIVENAEKTDDIREILIEIKDKKIELTGSDSKKSSASILNSNFNNEVFDDREFSSEEPGNPDYVTPVTGHEVSGAKYVAPSYAGHGKEHPTRPVFGNQNEPTGNPLEHAANTVEPQRSAKPSGPVRPGRSENKPAAPAQPSAKPAAPAQPAAKPAAPTQPAAKPAAPAQPAAKPAAPAQPAAKPAAPAQPAAKPAAPTQPAAKSAAPTQPAAKPAAPAQPAAKPAAPAQPVAKPVAPAQPAPKPSATASIQSAFDDQDFENLKPPVNPFANVKENPIADEPIMSAFEEPVFDEPVPHEKPVRTAPVQNADEPVQKPLRPSFEEPITSAFDEPIFADEPGVYESPEVPEPKVLTPEEQERANQIKELIFKFVARRNGKVNINDILRTVPRNVEPSEFSNAVKMLEDEGRLTKSEAGDYTAIK